MASTAAPAARIWACSYYTITLHRLSTFFGILSFGWIELSSFKLSNQQIGNAESSFDFTQDKLLRRCSGQAPSAPLMARILGKLSAFALPYPLEAGVMEHVAQNKHGWAGVWGLGVWEWQGDGVRESLLRLLGIGAAPNALCERMFY